jgi:NAD(P)-dependent dehydrogenase (short-subunit alcohol dehydrogenase family)
MSDRTALSDRVCFITGGGSGIGRATVAMLAQHGARVFVLTRSPAKVAELERAFGERVAALAGDATDEATVAAAFAACRERFGPVELLLNNAGLGLPTPDLASAELDTFEQMLALNLKAVFLCTRAALQDMKPRRAGHILTVISMAGQRTNAGSPLYCASKFGARGLNSGLADQVLKLGIKVTDLNPGPVDTPYWGERDVPRERFLRAEDVAEVIRFVVTAPPHVLIREINFDNIHWLAG